jgi:SAM-dependent methyltransferase
MRRHDDIAARGSRAVEDLRSGQDWVERQLHFDGQELLDLESTPSGVKLQILHDVERLTRLFLLDRFWTHRIGKMIVEARRTRRGKPVRVLDVGAGGGGLLFRIADWARARRIPVELHGVDAAPEAVAIARRAAEEQGAKVRLERGDARDLGHESGSMDVVVSTFMLHHLPPGDAARVLAELDRVAAVNFFAFDLRRSLPALPALWAILRIGAFDAPSRHDAIASLRRGYTVPEVEALLAAAGVANVRIAAIPPAFFTASRA